MSYKNLHIILLILLLGLDFFFVNLSGIAAFWLRCRTALFDDVKQEVVDLTQDDHWWGGVADGIRIRQIGQTNWFSLDGDQKPQGQAFEVDLGTQCFVGHIVLEFTQLQGDQIDLVVNGLNVPFEKHKQGSVIRLEYIQREMQTFQLTLAGADVQASHIRKMGIYGYDLNRPRIFSRPAVHVPQEPYNYLLIFWNVAALFALLYCGAYRITRSLEILDDFFVVMKAITLASISVIVALFLYRGYQEVTYWGFEFSRLVVLMSTVFATIFLTVNRAIIDAIHLFFIKRGFGIRKVLVIGAGPVGRRIAERLQMHYWLAYQPVGFVDDNPALHGQTVAHIPVLGGTDKLTEHAAVCGTQEVIVALPNSSHKAVRDVVDRCHSAKMTFHIVPDLFEIISSDVRVGAIDGVPILDLDDHYLGRWDRMLKRGMDVLGGVLCLAVLGPLMGLLAVLIKISSRGPVLFSQLRVGEHGKTFSCFKFRTMRVISDEEEKEERQKLYRQLIDGAQTGGKIINKRRVTWIGSFMRRYRLDELAQVFNVLNGNMSWIGPRPPIPYEVENYNTWHMERFKGKPGITGLWQVSGGPDLSFEEMVKLDIFYLKNWSLWLDFKIMIKTIPVVLAGKGA